MNSQFLAVAQIVLGVVLVVLILLQAKGTGLGSTFGGDVGFYRTKRGLEKLLFKATIAVSVLFLLSSLISLL